MPPNWTPKNPNQQFISVKSPETYKHQSRLLKKKQKQRETAGDKKHQLQTSDHLSSAAIDRPQTVETILPPIPDVLWQQVPETYEENSQLGKIDNKPTFETTRNTQTPESKQGTDVESQFSTLKVNSRQKSGSIRNPCEKSTPRVNHYRASSPARTFDPKTNKHRLTSQPFELDLILLVLSK